MIIFLAALAAFGLLVGIVGRKLRWIKTGGELGKARRAVATAARPAHPHTEFGHFAQEWSDPPAGFTTWSAYEWHKASEGPR